MLFKGGSVLEPPLSQMQLTDKPAKSRAVSPSKTRLQLTGRSRSVINAAPSLPHCGVRGHCVTRRRARRDRRGIRREIKSLRHFRASEIPRRFSGSTGSVKFRFGKQNLFIVPLSGHGTQASCFHSRRALPCSAALLPAVSDRACTYLHVHSGCPLGEPVGAGRLPGRRGAAAAGAAAPRAPL